MTLSVIEQSFHINILIMKYCHLFPPEECAFLYKIHAYLIYVLFVIPVPTLGIFFLLLEENFDVEKVNYNAAFLAQTACFITKLLPFITIGHRIRKCIMYFESPLFTVTKDKHQEILNTCIQTCRKNTFAFLVCAVGAVGSWATKPIFWKGRQLPVDIWLPFDFTSNFMRYCSTYFWTAIGPIVSSLATGVIDPLIAGLAAHAASQMKILKDNLQHLSKYAGEEVSRMKEGDEGTKELQKHEIIYEKIAHSIDHYEAILSFVTEYEICFSWVIFSQIAASIFVICFCCLQLSEVETVGYYFVQLIVYFSVILGEIYFYCYYGSTLSEECETLINAVYMGNWYDYDAKCKKALIILMERSKKPVVVTAGKILDLSLVTFMVILKRSYSLLAVLKNYS